jgi:hypothetical protein
VDFFFGMLVLFSFHLVLHAGAWGPQNLTPPSRDVTNAAANQAGMNERPQVSTLKEAAMRKTDVLHEIGLLSRRFAKLDNPPLAVGELGQFWSDQVPAGHESLVTRLVTRSGFREKPRLQVGGNTPPNAGFDGHEERFRDQAGQDRLGIEHAASEYGLGIRDADGASTTRISKDGRFLLGKSYA